MTEGLPTTGEDDSASPEDAFERVILERSRQDLEWREVTERIAREAMSSLAAAAARGLVPLEDRERVIVRQQVLTELLALTEAGADLPVRDVTDVSETVERVRRHGVASGIELAGVASTIRTGLSLVRFGQAHADRAPNVARLLSVDPELANADVELSRCLDERGEVLDQASHALADARSEVRRLRKQVQKRVGELIGRFRDALQDGYYAERDGRYVLPVRTDAPYRVEGIVLGTSASGSTLYVEPVELGKLGNQLRMAEVEVERETARVLAELSTGLVPFVDEILWVQELCVRADLLAAIVRFSRRIGAQVVPLASERVLELRAVRHPLLCDGDIDVVENDLRVASGHGLVLSGPNAGGKTVAMKCLGLVALMQAAGLPVPVEPESRVGFWPRVFSDIGDDQSLSQSLSTFSGHVERVRDVLALSGPDALVLLDELMGGTDPGEGAVLAIAMVDALTERGAAVAVTTHYDALKDHAATVDHLDNAAAGFDFDAMEPTFHVESGRPGASSALSVALRHGLPPQVTERAKTLLPEIDARQREDRQEVEQLRARLERERAELATEIERHATLNRRLEEEERKLKEARRKDLAREGDELRDAVRAARAELRSVRTRMKGAVSAVELREIERGIGDVSSVVTLGSEVDQRLRGHQSPSRAAAEPMPLRVGARVKLKGMKTEAEVLEAPKKGKVRVAAGAMKLTVSVDEVEVVGGPRPKQKAAQKPSRKELRSMLPTTRETPARSQDVSLDLRGHRVEESLSEVDSFVDELLRRQEGGGYVLHGHGTGALKEAVRTHLRAHPCIVESRACDRDEGGDAWTVFWLSTG